MTITAKVIEDSVSPDGIRLTTMQLRYPKFIHGEFMTHRVFSRNASSSRAIPVERLIQDVLDDPAMPVFWGANHPGMQAVQEFTGTIDWMGEGMSRECAWLMARELAVQAAQAMARAGLHKQIVNRIIEPWCHINVVVTATDWANFYALRRHPDAQPEMRALADAMWDAQQASVPKRLFPGHWHLPYVTDDERASREISMIKLSVARCARVSYLTHDGKVPDVAADLALYDRLVGSVPLHASPAEHQATPDIPVHHGDPTGRLKGGFESWINADEHGNLRGWRQYRKMLPNESVNDSR